VEPVEVTADVVPGVAGGGLDDADSPNPDTPFGILPEDLA
jgi:hypothetical protein